MLTNDEAVTVGVRKYRELYPKGTLPPSLEEAGVLGSFPGELLTTIHITYCIKGQRDPFVLFQAIVDRASAEITVEIAAEWQQLQQMPLDTSQHL